MADRIEIGTYRPENIPALVALINEADAVDGFERATTAAELEHEMTWPTHHPEADCFLAWSGDRLAGYADMFVQAGDDGPWRTVWTWGVVHPEWRRRGVGRRLLEAGYRRAEELLPEITGSPVHFQATCLVAEAGTRALYESLDMQPVRHYVNMARPLNSNLPPVECPPGHRLRPFDRERDARMTWRVDVDAFRDHWGSSGMPWEVFEHMMETHHFRPELWFVVEEEAGGQVVGIGLNTIDPEWIAQTGRQEGYVQTLGVLREHRRQGLGSALLAHSLHVLRGAGMAWAHLNADAENLSGAVRLYERQGFEVRKLRVTYRRTLRAASAETDA